MTDNIGLKNLLSQESREKTLKSPKQIGEKVRVTAAPIYLLAAAENHGDGSLICYKTLKFYEVC